MSATSAASQTLPQRNSGALRLIKSPERTNGLTVETMLYRLNFTFQYKADMSHQARVALWAREAGFGSSAKKLGAGLNLLKTVAERLEFVIRDLLWPNVHARI